MATYAIGDIQGCYRELLDLLELVNFDRNLDQLWFTGDLVNRGPQNVETLRFVHQLGECAITVHGNHDLHLLAIVFGGHKPQSSDTFHDVLSAPDCEELCQWLRGLPLMHVDKGHVLVHAGIPHIWSLSEAQSHAGEVEESIRGPNYADFFTRMYGNRPSLWSENLQGMDRLRIITNYLTRMRFIGEEGNLDFSTKTTILDAPEGYREWFNYPSLVSQPIVFGHWAAIEGVTDTESAFAVDTGCVWGRELTALRIEDHALFRVPARQTADETLASRS